MTTLWLVLAGVFLIVEVCTAALVSVWFVIGAIAALIASAAGAAFWLQIVLFVAASTISFAFGFPFAKRCVSRVRKPTNADMVIGKKGIVAEQIENIAATGLVYIDGKPWSARSKGQEIIEKGSIVKVCQIEGVKVIVTPTSDKHNQEGKL